jgi:RNA polymerase sigma-70 factor, ECF subfamily
MWVLWAVIDRWPRAGRSDDRAADQACLERMASGDREALAEVYDRHARPIYSLALRILQDQAEAEDIVQEVFAQAWRQASRYDQGRGNVAAWLLTLARSRAIDRLRARRARPELAPEERAIVDMPDRAVGADVQLVSEQEAARVRDALHQLPLVQRVALELAYYEGLTHTEIAARLEQPLGTVKTRIRQALIKLRESLAATA